MHMRQWIGVLLTCGWVLWGLTYEQIWEPQRGYDTFSACEEDRQAWVHVFLQPQPTERKFTKSTITDMQCFPDSIDPRQAK
jgi:hypothetical protein